MKHTVLILTLVVSLSAMAQNKKVSSKDLQPLVGSWAGQLTYLDYSDNKAVGIKASLMVKKKNENFYQFNFSYPDEPGQSSRDDYNINKKGTMIGDKMIIERSVQEDSSLKIVLEENGKDGNDQKPATFRSVMIITKKTFTVTKLVRFDGEDKFFQRHQYSFSR